MEEWMESLGFYSLSIFASMQYTSRKEDAEVDDRL